MFAHDQIQKGDDLDPLQLFVIFLVFLIWLVLFAVVIGRVSEIEIPVDFLIDFGGLLEVACFEKISSHWFQMKDPFKLFCNWHLIEVLIFGDPDQANEERNITFRGENCVLIEQLGGEVGL